MKKVIGYIIRLTAILLSVIFLTVNDVDVAIAANNVEVERIGVKPFNEEKPSTFGVASNNCPSYTIPEYCDFGFSTNSFALRRYKNAVSRCEKGGGTEKLIKAAQSAYLSLIGSCEDELKLPEEPIRLR